MRNISREELEEILVYLKTEVTPEELKWLIKNFSEVPWTDFQTRYWNERHASNIETVCERIDEILDARIRRKRYHVYSDLAIEDLLEIAKILNLRTSWRTIKRKIIEMILEEVKKCKHCKGTGKVGTADSTVGPSDIVCLDCLGTGKAKR